MKKIAMVTIMFLVVGLGIVWAADDFTIVPPDSGSPDWMAGLSGKWAGDWECRTAPRASKLHSELIFLKISPDGTSAKCIYRAGDKSYPVEATITAGKRSVKISFYSGREFSFTLKGGLLEGQLKANTAQGNYVWDIIMKKVP